MLCQALNSDDQMSMKCIFQCNSSTRFIRVMNKLPYAPPDMCGLYCFTNGRSWIESHPWGIALSMLPLLRSKRLLTSLPEPRRRVPTAAKFTAGTVRLFRTWRLPWGYTESCWLSTFNQSLGWLIYCSWDGETDHQMRRIQRIQQTKTRDFDSSCLAPLRKQSLWSLARNKADKADKH